MFLNRLWAVIPTGIASAFFFKLTWKQHGTPLLSAFLRRHRDRLVYDKQSDIRDHVRAFFGTTLDHDTRNKQGKVHGQTTSAG